MTPTADQRPASGRSAAVFLGGVYEDGGYYALQAAAADLVVAADGAAAVLVSLGIRPDVVVGDLDSLPRDVLAGLVGMGVEVKRFPARKDATDGELAAGEAVLRGAGEVVLAGALGALDHTLGHLAILRQLASSGVPARLASPELAVRVLVAPAEGILDSPPPTRVSLVALGGDAVVTLRGLEYTLTHQRLPWDACLGVGNSIVAALPSVLVHEGTVAVLVASGRETFGQSRESRAT